MHLIQCLAESSNVGKIISVWKQREKLLRVVILLAIIVVVKDRGVLFVNVGMLFVVLLMELVCVLKIMPHPSDILNRWKQTRSYLSDPCMPKCHFCNEEMTETQAETNQLIYIGGMTDSIYHSKCYYDRTRKKN